MKRTHVLCGRLLLMACMTVCFTHVALAGSGNEAFRSVNHKGYNTLAPENTLPAFELSAQMGYQYVETDISFTKDGVPVLLHNSNINVMARIPDGSELAQELIEIDTLTCEEALQYDFTKGMEDYKGTKIARLDGMELEEDDYELTWSEGCTEPGTYQVTARLTKGILAGADTAEFTIMEADKVLSDKKQDGQGQS